MSLWSRFNKPVFWIFVRTNAWLLLFSMLPAGVYAYFDSLWAGVEVFFVFAIVSTLGLLWSFWGALFPKDDGNL